MLQVSMPVFLALPLELVLVPVSLFRVLLLHFSFSVKKTPFSSRLWFFGLFLAVYEHSPSFLSCTRTLNTVFLAVIFLASKMGTLAIFLASAMGTLAIFLARMSTLAIFLAPQSASPGRRGVVVSCGGVGRRPAAARQEKNMMRETRSSRQPPRHPAPTATVPPAIIFLAHLSFETLVFLASHEGWFS